MELFCKYQSRSFQFVLMVLTKLENQTRLTGKELDDLASSMGLEYAQQGLEPLLKVGMLKMEGRDCLRGEEMQPFCLPFSNIEEEYLAYILSLPVAEQFLSQEGRAYLCSKLNQTENALSHIQRVAPEYRTCPAHEHVLQTLLQAIREGRMVTYEYQTRQSKTLQKAHTFPWKVEYGVFDQRWWVIFYHPEEKRTIKAKLEHIDHVELAEKSNLTSVEIEESMKALLEPEPVVLAVTSKRGALERCFLTFEDQLFLETKRSSSTEFQLSFCWYRFDRNLILRKLLYLGPEVTLLSPKSLKMELKQLLEQALEE